MTRRVVGLTVVLGVTVVMSWVAVRGTVLNGPGPFLDPSWFAIWTIQAALAILVGFVLGRAWWRDVSTGTRGGLVAAAWLGELIVVTALAPLLAGELTPAHGPRTWLVATGGPIQPLAAMVGMLVGQASIRAAMATSSG
jgi:hypothetical protein